MNKMILLTIALSTILASCSQKTSSVGHSSAKNRFVLGAFVDVVSESSFNKSELKDLPKIVDLSADMSAVKNQDQRGTCSFFATMGMIEGVVKKSTGKEVNFSEEYLNYRAKRDGSYESLEGSAVAENIRAVKNSGLLLEEDWSYQASWFQKGLPCEAYKAEDVTAPKICFSHNKPNAKALARLVDSGPLSFYSMPKNTNDIIKHLALNKSPLAMSIIVNSNGWDGKTGEVKYSEKLRQQCLNDTDDSDCGSHVILLTGYDMNKKVFMFKNSWGTTWGNKGYGTVPFDVVDRYTTEDLYFVELDGELKLPETKSAALKLNNFDVQIVKNDDHSVTVNLDSSIEETSGKMIYMSSYLMKKSKNYRSELPSDGNLEPVRITDETEAAAAGDITVRALAFHVPQEENSLVLKSAEGGTLSIEAKAFAVPSIAELLNSDDYDKVIRTTLFVIDDIEGWKILKRVYTPLK